MFILNTFTESIGGYLANIVPMSFRTASYGDSAFVSGWTIFYWAWWISWAPFVGVFIARISRGRTIREFVFGVILAPSIVSFVWFSVLGGAAINLQLTGAANISKLAAANQPAALFATLQQFPLFWLTAMIAIILVALFFVSGADAASVVMGMLSTKGDLHPKAWTVIVWGVFTGSAAAVCLLAGAIQGSVDAALTGPAIGGHRVGGAFRADPDRAVLLHHESAARRAVADRGARTRSLPSRAGRHPARPAPRHRSRCRRRTPKSNAGSAARKARI